MAAAFIYTEQIRHVMENEEFRRHLEERIPLGRIDDPKDMKNFLENVEVIRKETNAHILIVIHTGKDTDRGMRGSSMLRDYADLVMSLKELKDGEKVCIAFVDKMKDGDDDRQYAFASSRRS